MSRAGLELPKQTHWCADEELRSNRAIDMRKITRRTRLSDTYHLPVGILALRLRLSHSSVIHLLPPPIRRYLLLSVSRILDLHRHELRSNRITTMSQPSPSPETPQAPLWFERKFDLSFPVELFPNLCIRLRGTPARLEGLAAASTPKSLPRAPAKPPISATLKMVRAGTRRPLARPRIPLDRSYLRLCRRQQQSHSRRPHQPQNPRSQSQFPTHR